jgi:hypothetical protein
VNPNSYDVNRSMRYIFRDIILTSRTYQAFILISGKMQMWGKRESHYRQ